MGIQGPAPAPIKRTSFSGTPVNMDKVAEMLRAGWSVKLFVNDLGTFTVFAKHSEQASTDAVNQRLRADYAKDLEDSEDREAVDALLEEMFGEEFVVTEDFSPEQALTRTAYKTLGEDVPGDVIAQ